VLGNSRPRRPLAPEKPAARQNPYRRLHGAPREKRFVRDVLVARLDALAADGVRAAPEMEIDDVGERPLVVADDVPKQGVENVTVHSPAGHIYSVYNYSV
jgi:hypothetical protein